MSPLNVPVFQIWLGNALPPQPYLDCMGITASQTSTHFILTGANSQLKKLFPKSHFIDILSAYAEAWTHPNVLEYLESPELTKGEISDVLRFAVLSVYSHFLYVDCDAYFVKPPDIKSFNEPTFSNFGNDADVFLIYGAGRGQFFRDHLHRLPVRGGYAPLQFAIRKEPSRFPRECYNHLTRTAYYAA